MPLAVIRLLTLVWFALQKCVLYWPERRGIYGKTEVLVNSVRECEHFTVRSLTLKVKSHSHRHNLSHIQCQLNHKPESAEVKTPESWAVDDWLQLMIDDCSWKHDFYPAALKLTDLSLELISIWTYFLKHPGFRSHLFVYTFEWPFLHCAIVICPSVSLSHSLCPCLSTAARGAEPCCGALLVHVVARPQDPRQHPASAAAHDWGGGGPAGHWPQRPRDRSLQVPSQGPHKGLGGVNGFQRAISKVWTVSF